MAEINTSAPKANGRRIRSARISTKIDMTPMVDLGFLLITFFMLTTTLQKPKVMPLGMPEPSIKTMPVKDSNALTVILEKDRKIKYFNGLKGQEKLSNFKDIRSVLLENRARIGEGFFVIIKANQGATYGSLVDILDELAITSCPSYAIQPQKL
jgi:biopolymer transport protein ExbD